MALASSRSASSPVLPPVANDLSEVKSDPGFRYFNVTQLFIHRINGDFETKYNQDKTFFSISLQTTSYYILNFFVGP